MMLACRAASLLAFAVAIACAPTETGNPPASDSLLFTAGSSAPDDIAVSPDTAPVSVEALWLGSTTLGYIPCDGDATNSVYLKQEASAMELVSGDGALAVGAVPDGSYCLIFMQGSAVPGDEVPAELHDYSFFSTGSLASGAKFEILGDDIGLEHAFPNPIVRGPSSPNLLLELDVAHLLSPLALDQAAPDTDGVVHVNKSIVTGDPSGFREGFRTSVSLHEDLNGNGRVDANEPDLF